MNKGEAIHRFMGTEFEDLVYEYKDADEYCKVHDTDPDLWEIWVPLPIAPDWDLIDGWGLDPDDQVFD